MSVRERMLTLRLLAQINRHPQWADRLGITGAQEIIAEKESIGAGDLEEPP